MEITVKGRKFSISYGNTIVTVRQNDGGDFDEALNIIDGDIMLHFHRSQPGSEWGCDGIGYMVEKAHGKAFRNKSGVGSRKYSIGLKELGL
jgi:hypothetical protein